MIMKKLLILLFGILFIGNFSAQRRMKDYKDIMRSRSIYEIDAFLKDAHPEDPRRDVLKPRLMNLIADYIKTAHPADQSIKTMQEKLALLKRRPNTFISFEEMKAEWREKEIERYKQELEAIRRGDFKAYVKPKHDEKAKPTEAQRYAAKVSGRSSNVKSFTSTGMTTSEQDEFDMLMSSSSAEHQQKTVKILNALFDNDPNSRETTVLVENKSDCDIIVRMEGANNLKYRLPVASKTQNTIVIQKGDYLFSSIVCGAQYASQKTVGKAIMVALGNPRK